MPRRRPLMRRFTAWLLCGSLLIQASPGLAQSIEIRREPRGWPLIVSAASGTAGWLHDRAGRTTALLSGVAYRLEILAALTARLAAGSSEPSRSDSQVPPDPPEFAAETAPGSVAPVMPAQATDVPLLPSWNLVSLPSRPVDPSPAAVLSSLGTGLRKAYVFDNCDPADPWKVYDPADPAGSNLIRIDERAGLWIDSSQATGLPSPGDAPLLVTLHLCPGWNLIGFPANQPRPVASALSSIAGKYQRVFSYEAADPADPWELYDVSIPAWANDLQVLRPGHGYWILATEETDLQIVNDGSDLGVELAQPAQLAEITEPVPVIGTVRGQTLTEWELRYRSLDGGEWFPLATGNAPATGRELASFDPTLLLNGLYEIELSATGADGKGVSISTHAVVEGQQKLGHFSLSFLDLDVPLSGVPIRIVRTYDSREARSRDFGHGWTLQIRQGSYRNNRTPGEGWRIVDGFLPCQSVQETLPHLTTVRLSDQEIYRFRLTLTRPAVTAGGCFAEAGFAFVDGPVPGASLSVVGGSGVFYANGTSRVVEAESLEPYEPRNVRLETRDGRIFDLDIDQGLTRLRDMNGNELQITAGSIAHSSGRSLDLTRDSQGRITEITDPLGFKLRYSYDAAGDLVSFTNQADQTTRFTYDGNHRLLSMADPSGVQPIRNDYDAAGRLLRSTDAFNKSIALTYDLAAHREVVTDRLGQARVVEYDSRGNAVRETDVLGHATSRTFDTDDMLLSETNPLGHTTRYTYDSNRNLIRVDDPLGHRTAYTYNSRGQVLTVTDARGKTTSLAYDAAGNLLRIEDPLGNATAFAYDSRGNLLSETDAEGGTTAYAYDTSGNLTRETDALGTVTTSTYDARGNLLTRTTDRTTSSGTETLTWTYEYDPAGRLVKVIDADGTAAQGILDALGRLVESIDKLGRRTAYTYDDLGRLTRMRHPDGTTEIWTFDAEGRRLTATNRGGQVTSYTYDGTGRLLSATLPDRATVSSSYDDAGQLVTATDALGNTTAFAYDAAGRRTRVTDALGQERVFSFDENGNPLTATDARGNTTVYEYDDANRPARIRFPDGSLMQSGYDRLGRRISQTDQAGLTTWFGYDPLGRLLTVKDALNQVTRYTYDEQNNRTSQTDANGNTTRFEYDQLGRLLKRELPGGAAESFSYDAAGNRKTHHDFNGALTTYTYDAADRLLARVYADSASARFTYSPTGKRLTAIDARGTTAYEYDNRDRLKRLVYPDGRELRYSYDAYGNRTHLVAQVAGQTLATAYTYDRLNRLETVTDPWARTYSFSYDPNGNQTSITYPNGITTTYQYDSLNRLTSLAALTSSGQPVLSFQYTLGPTGNRTRIAEHGGTQRDYSYDPLFRLTRESITRSGGTVDLRELSYDAAGNRLSQRRQQQAGPVLTTSYAYDNRDRLLKEDTRAYGWDSNGRLSAKGDEATYEWSPDGRLTQVKLTDGTTVRHTYDVDGVRVRTEVVKPDGTVTAASYLVDIADSLPQVVAETDGTGALTATYVRGSSLLAAQRGAATSFYHADGLGSTRALTDSGGAVTDRYTYSAFGELLEHQGTDPNPYLYAGEAFDPQTGLYYLRARWMDPAVGRFGNQDRFAGLPGEPLSLHRYLYASDDPANRVDPSGYFAEFTVANLIQGTLFALNVYSFGANIWQGSVMAHKARSAAASGYLMEATGWTAGAVIHYGVAALAFLGTFSGMKPPGPMPQLAGAAAAGNLNAGMVWQLAASNPALADWMINQVAPAILGSALGSISFAMGNSGGSDGESSASEPGSGSSDPGLNDFVARLKAAGVKVKRVNFYEVGKEVDIELENGTWLEYKSGVAAPYKIIDQLELGNARTKQPIVFFLEASGKAAQRTIYHAGRRGAIITNDFDLLISVIKD